MTDDRARSIEGTVTLADGSTSKFIITADYGWQQWGATQDRLIRSGPIMDALIAGLADESLVISDSDPEDAGEDEDEEDPEDDTPAGEYAIKVDGEEIDHADTPAEARRARDTINYGGIGTEGSTTIEPRINES